MILADLKNYRVTRDDIHRTFEKATYSFLIEERCPYHFQSGISYCSVARCHAGAKLISDYLSQLYVPARRSSTSRTEAHLQNLMPNNTNQSSSHRGQPSVSFRYDNNSSAIVE